MLGTPARGGGAVRMIAFAQAGSVQPQLSDVPRIRAQLIAFHALDDVRQHGIGAAREADLLALAHHEAVEEFDLRAPALLHVLAHGGTLLGGGALAVLEALLVAGAHRRLVALARTRNRLGRQMQNLLQLIAVRLPDADRFAPQPSGEAADRLALQHLSAGQARAGGESVAHGVGDQFRPALAPQIAGYLGAVGVADQAADFFRPLRDPAVHFAGAKYGVRRPALAGAAVDVAGLRQVDRDAARNAPERLAPADDAGDRLFIHAVLQRHDVAVRRQILPDQRGGPGRVVGLHAHEGDVDRRLLGEPLRVRDVQRAHGNREFCDVPGVGDAQAVLPHVLDMLGPWIDERHVLARLHHMGAGIPADGTRSDNSYLPTHAFLPAFLAAEASAPAGLITTVEPRRARRQALFVYQSPFVHPAISFD